MLNRSTFADARAVLMDIDGTLLDSVEAQSQCWLRVLQDFGYSVDYRQVRSRIGLGPDRVLKELCGVSEASARAQRLLPIREELLRSHDLPQLQTLPGVYDFLRHVQSSGAKLAVVTSAYRSEALALLGAAQLLTDFDHVICREDVGATKPSPSGLQVALERMGVRREEALVIASTPYDLAAAHAGRVPCVALQSGGWPDSALLGQGHAYRNLADLLAHWDSPLSETKRPLSSPPPASPSMRRPPLAAMSERRLRPSTPQFA